MSDGPLRLDFDAAPGPRVDRCGGALLRLDRDAMLEFRRNGLRFSSVEDHGTERRDCRVDCADFAEPGRGLCGSCSRLEADMRAALRGGR